MLFTLGRGSCAVRAPTDAPTEQSVWSSTAQPRRSTSPLGRGIDHASSPLGRANDPTAVPLGRATDPTAVPLVPANDPTTVPLVPATDHTASLVHRSQATRRLGRHPRRASRRICARTPAPWV